MLNPSASLQQLAAGLAFTALAAVAGACRFLKESREQEETQERRFREFLSDEVPVSELETPSAVEGARRSPQVCFGAGATQTQTVRELRRVHRY